MATALISAPGAVDLREMSLADAPDLYTAIAAGIAHGLEPHKALDSAFGKFLSENAEDVQRFKLANLYEVDGTPRAMQDLSRLVRFLCINVVEQGRELRTLREEVATMRLTP